MSYVTKICTLLRSYLYSDRNDGKLISYGGSYFQIIGNTIKSKCLTINDYIDNRIKNRYKLDDDFLILCDICMESDKTIALIPCGHVYCELCSKDLKDCPVCREKIREKLKLFL